MSVLLEVRGVDVSYGNKAVLHDLSLHVNRGNFACLLGPSGCGKTTALRAIAGFERVDRGEIRLRGNVVSRPGSTMPPERRKVGMVFQEDALFPHLTVEGNIAFGLKKLERNERRARVEEMLDVVGLKGLGEGYVHELSGGQQQRVALARALAPAPDVVLLDEPFSSLDVDLRARLGEEVKDILKQQGVTTILVTHDQNEAFALADHIGVIRDGRVLQWDTAYNLYHEPADRFIARFVGQGVFLRGTLISPDAVDTELGVIRGNRAYSWPKGSKVDVLLRPDDILPDPNGEVLAEVVSRAFKGAQILYALKLATGSSVLSLFPSHLNYETGETINIRLEIDHLVAFPVN
ncbi:MAG: ABC transporter ATP-binding protein [Gammaproteobacteria bacterium]|nr:ABC transporter ATP-binding protein [Gammaproteobacteria bacterium]